MTAPLVLGIETSCDDTACALVDGEGRVLASVVSSQLKVHQPWGGVVPELASREHLRNWPAVSAEALATAGVGWDDIGVVAATRGPGLVGALLVGLSLGKAIAFGRALPFHAVHHLEGHLYSPFLDPEGGPAEPRPERFLGMVVSGGHSALYEVDGDAVRTVAETRDDAIGEAFDKVGKRAGLAYPQGPVVDRLAELGDARRRAPLPIPSGAGDSLFFSYSGLKSQTILELDKLVRVGVPGGPDADGNLAPEVLDLLAAFREAAVGQLLDRLDRLRRVRPFPLLAVSGGVAANRYLRSVLPPWCEERGIALRLVPLRFSGDNAAMIAFAALLRERRGLRDDPFTADAVSRVPMGG